MAQRVSPLAPAWMISYSDRARYMIIYTPQVGNADTKSLRFAEARVVGHISVPPPAMKCTGPGQYFCQLSASRGYRYLLIKSHIRKDASQRVNMLLHREGDNPPGDEHVHELRDIYCMAASLPRLPTQTNVGIPCSPDSV